MPMPPRSVIRAVWILFTLALLTATHWPGLAVPPSPFSRLDLVIHACLFGFWTFLLYHCGWIALKSCPLRRVVWTGVIGVCFGVFDELTQPLFTRVTDPWDVAADTTGAVLACLLIWAGQSMMRTPPSVRSQEA